MIVVQIYLNLRRILPVFIVCDKYFIPSENSFSILLRSIYVCDKSSFRPFYTFYNFILVRDRTYRSLSSMLWLMTFVTVFFWVFLVFENWKHIAKSDANQLLLVAHYLSYKYCSTYCVTNVHLPPPPTRSPRDQLLSHHTLHRSYKPISTLGERGVLILTVCRSILSMLFKYLEFMLTPWPIRTIRFGGKDA